MIERYCSLKNTLAINADAKTDAIIPVTDFTWRIRASRITSRNPQTSIIPPKDNATTIRQIVSNIEVIPPRVKSCVKSPPTCEKTSEVTLSAGEPAVKIFENDAAALAIASGAVASAKVPRCSGT